MLTVVLQGPRRELQPAIGDPVDVEAQHHLHGLLGSGSSFRLARRLQAPAPTLAGEGGSLRQASGSPTPRAPSASWSPGPGIITQPHPAVLQAKRSQEAIQASFNRKAIPEEEPIDFDPPPPGCQNLWEKAECHILKLLPGINRSKKRVLRVQQARPVQPGPVQPAGPLPDDNKPCRTGWGAW